MGWDLGSGVCDSCDVWFIAEAYGAWRLEGVWNMWAIDRDVGGGGKRLELCFHAVIGWASDPW